VAQTLQGEGYHVISDFCQQIRLKINESHEFLEKLTFSDEKTYQINCQKSSIIGPSIFKKAKVIGEC
jgi:hypothetical protein